MPTNTPGMDQQTVAAMAQHAAWMVSLQFWLTLGVLGLSVIQFFRPRQPRLIEPQPLMVKEAQDWVTVEQGLRLEERLRKLESSREEDLRAASGSRGKMYDEMRKNQETTNQHIENVRRELGEKIDGMPAQVIAILKNTGAIT